ncbi:MAG TPA: ferritin [Bacteroidetes bacterium]|nr:ferritin [Bacteroidota bacterium]
MLNPKVEESLNDQLNFEFYSSYVYLAMAAYFEAENLPGMSAWMKTQAQEEVSHAMKFYGYLYNRMGRVALDKIDKPRFEWESPLAAFEDALRHEKAVTGKIHDIYKLARELDDPATENFLQWFIEEQVEEEASVDNVVQRLRQIGDFQAGLFFLDRELGTRQA